MAEESSSSSSSSSSTSSTSSSSSGRYSVSNVLVSTSSYFCLNATRLHTQRYSLTVKDAAGNVLPFDAVAVVRIKIGKHNDVPKIDLDSSTATANGSSITNENPLTLVLDQDDLAFAAAIYDIELLVMDDTSGAMVTHLATGIFSLEDTQLGDVAVS